jgi:apolipoprotein N-acyltransferase
LVALSRFGVVEVLLVVGACVSVFQYLALGVIWMGFASSFFVFAAFLWWLYENSKSGKRMFY